jgi:hypothetical protein
MVVRGFGVLMAHPAVFVGRGRVFLGLLMIAVLVVVGSLMMMVSGRVVVGRRIVVMLDRWMLSHGMYLRVKK